MPIDPSLFHRLWPHGVPWSRSLPKTCFPLYLCMEQQIGDFWCWAAAGACLANFYGTANWTQCDVASLVLDRDDCCSDSDACDETHAIDDALTKVGVYSEGDAALGKPTSARIHDEVCVKRHPPCVVIQWNGGGGHVILVRTAVSGVGWFGISDSIHGDSLQNFELFPTEYYDRGSWHATLYTHHVEG